MSSSHPPPLQRDLVGKGEGACRMLQEEASLGFSLRGKGL